VKRSLVFGLQYIAWKETDELGKKAGGGISHFKITLK
jgi:hypothetical protein